MENIIYRIHDTDLVSAPIINTLEFYLCQTNECNPYRKTTELGIVMYNNKKRQIDFSIEEHELDSLLEYLENMRRFISKFNRESKAIEEETCEATKS